MLEIKGVEKRFGGLVAVSNIDMTINKGEIVGLVGPNGAGKTTLLNVIAGIYRPDKGRVIFQLQKHFSILMYFLSSLQPNV